MVPVGLLVTFAGYGLATWGYLTMTRRAVSMRQVFTPHGGAHLQRVHAGSSSGGKATSPGQQPEFPWEPGSPTRAQTQVSQQTPVAQSGSGTVWT